MVDSDPDWRRYERRIYEKLKEWAGNDAEILFDQTLPGQLSGINRQIDATIRGRFAGHVENEVTAAVDCKHYSRRLDVTHVEAFMGVVEDVQTDLGLLITNEGFSAAAKRRARRGIRLHVIVAELDDLPGYSPAFDEPYYEGDYFDHSPYGPVGATIRYSEPYESEYPFDPEVGLEWHDEILVSGTDDELSWGDATAQEACARVILGHRLGHAPSNDQVESFVSEIAHEWQDGYPWVLFSGDLANRIGL